MQNQKIKINLIKAGCGLANEKSDLGWLSFNKH